MVYIVIGIIILISVGAYKQYQRNLALFHIRCLRVLNEKGRCDCGELAISSRFIQLKEYPNGVYWHCNKCDKVNFIEVEGE